MNAIKLDRCPICLERFSLKIPINIVNNLSFNELKFINPMDLTPTQTKCGHVFHANCLREWLETFKDKESLANCPSCRNTLITKPYKPCIRFQNTPAVDLEDATFEVAMVILFLSFSVFID